MIDHEGDEHLYVQLAAILIERIESGEIPPHRPIPSKVALRAQFEVSAGTVERALGILKERGVVRSLSGRGLFVTEPSEWRT